MIRIPLLEGEHPRANRNRRVGTLELVAHQLASDVSRRITARTVRTG